MVLLDANYTKCNSVVGKFRQSTGRSFSNNYFQATQIIDPVTSRLYNALRSKDDWMRKCYGTFFAADALNIAICVQKT